MNKVFKKLSGHKPEQFIGKSFAPLFDEENLKKAMDLLHKDVERRNALNENYVIKDTGVLCEFKNIPLRNEKREPNVGVTRNCA